MKSFSLLISLLLIASPAVATLITWTGIANDQEWGNSLNWSPMDVPEGVDDVVIPYTGLANYPLIISESVNCTNLTVEADAAITIGSAGWVYLFGDADFYGQLRWTTSFSMARLSVNDVFTWRPGSSTWNMNGNCSIYSYN